MSCTPQPDDQRSAKESKEGQVKYRLYFDTHFGLIFEAIDLEVRHGKGGEKEL
jgi:hypothetical protein